MRDLVEVFDAEKLQSLLGRPITLPKVREQEVEDAPEAWILTRGGNWHDLDIPDDVRATASRLDMDGEPSLCHGPVITPAGHWIILVDPNEDYRSGAAAHRRALMAAGRALRSLKVTQVVVGHNDLEARHLAAQIEGVCVGWYRFPKQQQATAPHFLLPKGSLSMSQRVAATIAGQATCLTKFWVEEAPNRLTPKAFAEQATTLGRQVGLQVEVIGPEALQEMGAGGILAVGKGSTNPPHLVLLQHLPDQTPEFGLVGKGITFDSGGISLKPPANMGKLKGDNAGAAAVLSAALAAAQLNSQTPFLAILPMAENLPDGRAYRPGDVITMLNGSTVDIVSTDAEGRMILADGLEIARRRGCRRRLTLATLTKAAIVALGYFRGALYANETAFGEQLLAAGINSGEFLWQMPLDDDYRRLLDSPVADLAHSSQLLGGGSIVAAKFIEHFASGAPWAHIDMSSIFYFDSAMPWADKGYTGSGARLLLSLLLDDAS